MKVDIQKEHLRINLSILEKMGAAKGSFYIPYDNIVSAISSQPYNTKGMKIAGTGLPKVLEMGTFLSGIEKQFWYIKKRKHNFLILVLKSNFYSKIILELENSEDLAIKIKDIISKK